MEELVGSLQTFEITLKSSVKKKGIALKVEKLSSPEVNSKDEIAYITKGFRKFYKQNVKNYRRKFSSRNAKDLSRRKEIFKDEVICYECKGWGHFASNCVKKKSKPKIKNKRAMTTTWGDNTND